jgi:hypothetical protein
MSVSQRSPAPVAGQHLVQFYEADENVLVANVGHYLADGLAAGEHALVVTTPGHQAAFTAYLERLGAQPHEALAGGRLIFLDAEATLARFLVNGYPDSERFDAVVGTLVRQARAAGAGLRAYGEMVGLLWQAGEYPAAIRLEQLWHRLLNSVDFRLYCGYPIDIFGRDFEAGLIDALLCSHTHLLSCGPDLALEGALGRAAREVLYPNVSELHPERLDRRSAWPDLPRAEEIVLWLRRTAPERAQQVLDRARDYYREVRAAEAGEPNPKRAASV